MKPRLIVLACLLVSACQEATEPLDSPSMAELSKPLASRSDGAHGGNEHFFFLPPMVDDPSPTGVFDGSLSPVVEICEWTGAECALPLLAEFVLLAECVHVAAPRPPVAREPRILRPEGVDHLFGRPVASELPAK